jgi:sugar phosphate isomerase/epimerase
MNEHPAPTSPLTRRNPLGLTAGAALAGLSALSPRARADHHKGGGVKNGRINQSVVFWCFNAAGEEWDLDKTCQITKELGGQSVELIGPEDWPTLEKHGLTCAIAPNGMPGAPFMKGCNNLAYHEEVITRTKEIIDACKDANVKNIIAFNGFKYRDADDPESEVISLEEGADNCVKALKELSKYGKKKGVTVCIEQLNTRDDTHPMKGHPGYQGDDMDYVAEIVKRVGSPNCKLLFDIYHVQVMNGDVIRRMEQYKDLIGHVHTAGNPGRCEIGEKQEIQYPACMHKLLEIGYSGFVGQEFIPTGDPYTGLKQAIELCDV